MISRVSGSSRSILEITRASARRSPESNRSTRLFSLMSASYLTSIHPRLQALSYARRRHELILLDPLRLQLRRPGQRLEDDAVLLRLAPQIFQLLLCSCGREDVEPGPDALETHGYVPGDAQSPCEVEIPLDLDFDTLGLYPHGLGDHLARDLGAGRECSEQKVSGAGGRTGTSDPRVSLGLVDGAADVHRAGDRGVGLAAPRPERYARGARLAAIPLLQRLLFAQKLLLLVQALLPYALVPHYQMKRPKWSWR